MTTEKKLDQILTLLNSIAEKQEAFMAKQELFNGQFDVSLYGVRYELADLRNNEELQHNLTHRLIMQMTKQVEEEKEPKALNR